MKEQKSYLKKLFCLIVLSFVCVLYYNYFYINQNDTILKKLLKSENQVRVVNKSIDNNKIKIILYWTKFWTWDYPIGLGSGPFRGCKYKNCLTTYNSSMLNLEDFDAIMFHGSIYDFKVHDKPKVRNVNQKYIYFNTEAPPNKFDYNPNFALFNFFYNFTITYRFDSDVRLRYGHVAKRKTNYGVPSVKDVEKKTKLVAWFVSHCNTSSKRELLVQEMQKYVPVDVYGKCGNLTCQRSGYFSTEGCYSMLENTYKFYLSFENSLCKDYFTEKIYYLLGKNVISVVYGGNDNTVIAPPYSFINVKDFKNVQDLTDYLKFLDNNTTEYLKYFEWKKDYIISNNPTNCDLCQRLNEPLVSKTYEDFYAWQWGNNSHPTCAINENLPPIIKNFLE